MGLFLTLNRFPSEADVRDRGVGSATVGPQWGLLCASARYFLRSLSPGSAPVSVVSEGEGSAVSYFEGSSGTELGFVPVGLAG